jgi:hypothetical protein
MAGLVRNLEAARVLLTMCGCCLSRYYSKTEAEAEESVSTAEWPSQTAVLAAPAARPGEHMMVSAVPSSFCFASLFSAGGGTKSPTLASRGESLVNWSGKVHDDLPVLTEQLGESNSGVRRRWTYALPPAGGRGSGPGAGK